MKIENSKYYKEMVTTIIEISSSYFISKKMILIKGDSIASGEFDHFNPYYLYIDRVNQTFLKLDNLDKEILYNEFFYPCTNDWWIPYYDKKTFVVMKTKAMKNFLREYNEL